MHMCLYGGHLIPDIYWIRLGKPLSMLVPDIYWIRLGKPLSLLVFSLDTKLDYFAC